MADDGVNQQGKDCWRRREPGWVRRVAAEPAGRLLLAVELGKGRSQWLGYRLQADCLPNDAGEYFGVLGVEGVAKVVKGVGGIELYHCLVMLQLKTFNLLKSPS